MNLRSQEHIESLPEIGGYFGLDLPDYGDLYPDALKFQSGRAAIRAVLECNGIKRVIMPAYNCGSIHKAAADAGVEVETYELDESLYPKNLPLKLSDQCVVMYVNYFGLSLRNVARLHEAIPADRLIIDNSQALFASHTKALATIYSPRKFVGLPDGGLLMASTSLSITPPLEEDQGSIDRMKHLLVRMVYSAREGYEDFHKARDSIRDTSPLAMSRLTRRLMKSIRWDQVIKRRRENYLIMAGMMDAINEMHWTLGENDAPLCYPLTMRGREINKVKKDLAEHNVFTATYWPDAAPRIKVGTIEEALLNETLFLPIDQRLDRAQVEEAGRLVLKLTGMRPPD
jgi:hypothetical protein